MYYFIGLDCLYYAHLFFLPSSQHLDRSNWLFWQSTKVEDLINTSNDSIFGCWFALSSLSRGTIWWRRHANVNRIVEYHFLLPCRSPPLGQIVSLHRLTMCHRHPKPMTIAALGVESHYQRHHYSSLCMVVAFIVHTQMKIIFWTVHPSAPPPHTHNRHGRRWTPKLQNRTT